MTYPYDDYFYRDFALNAYPVGAIYLSVNSTNPANLFGGAWSRIGQGRVLIGAGTGTDANSTAKTFSAGATGGEYTHLLTASESGVPAHTHGLGNHNHSMVHEHKMAIKRTNAEATGYGINKEDGFKDRVIIYSGSNTSSDNWQTVYQTASTTGAADGNSSQNTAAGATSYHNNIQPYLVVYMWKRIA